MKHTTWKKLLSLLLVVAMMSSFAVPALAEGGTVEDVDEWTNINPTVNLEIIEGTLPMGEKESITVKATVANAPETVTVKDGEKTVEYKLQTVKYEWSSSSAKTDTVKISDINADTTLTVTATLVYSDKDGNTGKSYTLKDTIEILSWNGYQAPTINLKSSAVEIGGTADVVASLKDTASSNLTIAELESMGWKPEIVYTWKTSVGGNSVPQDGTGSTFVFTPDQQTIVYAAATLQFSNGKNVSEKYTLKEVSTKVEPDWKNVKPTATLLVNGKATDKVVANNGDTVTVKAVVDTMTPKGWTAECKYNWQKKATGESDFTDDKTVTGDTYTLKVTDSVEIQLKSVTVTYKKDNTPDKTGIRVTVPKPVAINTGYSVDKYPDGPNYTLELTVGTGDDAKKITSFPAMVGNGATVSAEIVPDDGYRVTGGKIYYTTAKNGNATFKDYATIAANTTFGVFTNSGEEAVSPKTATLKFDLVSGLKNISGKYDPNSMKTEGDAQSTVNVTYGSTQNVAHPSATIEVTRSNSKKNYEVTGWKYEYTKNGTTVAVNSIDEAIAAADNGSTITAVAQWAEKEADISVTLPSSGTGYKVTRTSVAKDKYEEGDKITFTVEANAGYKLADLTPAVTKGSIVRNSYTSAKATFTYTVGDDDGTISYSSAAATAIKLTITLAPNLTNNGALNTNGTAAWRSGNSSTTLNTNAQTWTYAPSGTSTITTPSSGTLTGRSTVDSSKSYEAQGWTVSGAGITSGTNLSNVSVSAANLRTIVTGNNLHEDTAITLTAKWDKTISISAAMDFNFTTLTMSDSVKVSEDDNNYSYSLWNQLLNALGLTSSSASGYYVKFTSLGSSWAGTLYENSSRSNTYLVDTVTSYYLGSGYGTGTRFYSLEFEPNNRYEGYTYSASFDVYNGTGKVDSGTLNITTGIAGDVVVYLDDEDSVQFDERDFEDWYEDAASESRPSLVYVAFDRPDWDFDEDNGFISYGGTDEKNFLDDRDMDEDDYYVESEAEKSDKLIDSLYYVAGEKMEEYYILDFTGYGGGRNSADGKLVIITGESDEEESVDHDLVYNVEYDDTLKLSGSDFYDWVNDKGFEYITFDKDTLSGKLSYTSGSREYDIDTDEEYYYDSNRNTEIDELVYTPKNSTRYSQYTDVISFTAWDGNEELKSGTITFCVVADSVPPVEIEVDPKDSVMFKNTDFTAIASKAIGSSSSIDSIELLKLPGQGTLYVGSSGSTKASAGTQYGFGTASNSNKNVVSNLRYVAGNSKGSVTVPYIAYNKNDKVLFTGEIMITIGDTGLSSGSIYAVGSMLPVSTIKSQAEDILDEDFSYITVTQPDNAIIYYDYSKINDHSGAASETTKYYYQATSNQLSMSKLTVVPYSDRQSGEDIVVEINCYDEDDNVTKLSISFNYVKATNTGFTDTIDDWYKDSIYFLSSNGIAKGNGYSYGVGQKITRGDFILMLYRAFDLENVSGGSTNRNFADVNSNDYYYAAVVKAAKLGITTGQQGTDGKYYFNPTNPITREEAFTLIYRTMNINSIKNKLYGALPSGSSSALYKFTDRNSVQSYATTAVASLVTAGLVTGSDGQIKPANNISREEMAVVLHRALTRY